MSKQRKISLNIIKSIDIIIKKLTSFERDVLKAACMIGPGETRSYAWIARKINRPNSQRAVGQALKKNPLPFIIPCHRVVKSTGDSGGYALGADIKKELLKFEKEFMGLNHGRSGKTS